MASLAEIRAKLLEQDSRSSGTKSNTNKDNTVFPHWSIPDNTSASLRFLPDGDTNNPFFWLKREMIRLEFAGVKGGDESKPVTIQVPCIEKQPVLFILNYVNGSKILLWKMLRVSIGRKSHTCFKALSLKVI
jgi:hypothetical protein